MTGPGCVLSVLHGVFGRPSYCEVSRAWNDCYFTTAWTRGWVYSKCPQTLFPSMWPEVMCVSRSPCYLPTTPCDPTKPQGIPAKTVEIAALTREDLDRMQKKWTPNINVIILGSNNLQWKPVEHETYQETAHTWSLTQYYAILIQAEDWHRNNSGCKVIGRTSSDRRTQCLWEVEV